jgi:cyclopropane fatty-acyl-phospholipid synthase-like methyltransferase
MVEDPLARLALPHYPRSATYDARWLIDNRMGPNPLWLMEWLWPGVDLLPGSRVLDLACGNALTSIFLAREFGVRVVAADLWVPPHENWERIRAAGCADSVMPLRAEAHDLRFAHGYFDGVTIVDAYEYFGTADQYLGYLTQFLRPGGVVAIAEVGLTREIDELPEHLRPYWRPDFWHWKPAQWWRRHWTRSGAVDVVVAELMPDGWREWLLWEEICRDAGGGYAESHIEMLRADAGRHLGFVRVVARKR